MNGLRSSFGVGNSMVSTPWTVFLAQVTSLGRIVDGDGPEISLSCVYPRNVSAHSAKPLPFYELVGDGKTSRSRCAARHQGFHDQSLW